ncbi:prolactin releasing hormone 2 [Nerophis lumbriciformis]|uniref:prolactin releasing hormone 2 n=1 Tax=Nerophis lumbriciformis TaxID=546530 RepID=UPI002AE07F5D|nr:prolactin releasing hormone 2 [Nerophis lumbriciformis]
MSITDIYKVQHTCSAITTTNLGQLTSASNQSSGAFELLLSMFPRREAADVQARGEPPASLAPLLFFLLLLVSSCSLSSAHSTTVEHDFHIVHNVDNRSPEIDPFWYVGRGVRPIGRFGKRHSGVAMRPVVRTLELILNSLRNKENLDTVLRGEDGDWLP